MRMVSELQILLVEDSEADVLLIQRALSDEGLPHRLSVIRDGSRALVYLEGLPTAEQEMPDLVLLDLDLPGMDGAELLRQVKADPRLKALPVVVLSTSSREEDIWRAYQAGANSYVCKAPDFEVFRHQIWALHLFWAGVAERLPRRPPRPPANPTTEGAARPSL